MIDLFRYSTGSTLLEPRIPVLASPSWPQKAFQTTSRAALHFRIKLLSHSAGPPGRPWCLTASFWQQVTKPIRSCCTTAAGAGRNNSWNCHGQMSVACSWPHRFSSKRQAKERFGLLSLGAVGAEVHLHGARTHAGRDVLHLAGHPLAVHLHQDAHAHGITTSTCAKRCARCFLFRLRCRPPARARASSGAAALWAASAAPATRCWATPSHPPSSKGLYLQAKLQKTY